MDVQTDHVVLPAAGPADTVAYVAHKAADLVGNEGLGSQFRDDVGTFGIRDSLAWGNRRLQLRDGGWAFTGIRYRGRDITRPFIDVVASTAPPTLEGLALIAQTIVPTYAPFELLCLRASPRRGKSAGHKHEATTGSAWAARWTCT